MIKTIREIEDKYIALNAVSKMIVNGVTNYQADKDAAQLYLDNTIKPNLKTFSSIKERFKWLLENEYYEEKIVNKYCIEDIKMLRNYADEFNFKFPSFMGAVKFFNSYGLTSFENNQFLETYEDRVLMNALLLANGDVNKAKSYIKMMMTGRFQPATPTFLNAGKKSRGEYVSCYLLRIEDNMESISRGISHSLQLSKRGGGVALCLTNIREFGAPIKKIKNRSTGIIPVMKLLEDSFSYANQLGQRQGAGAVYLNAHHPDILTFLDTKRENADEKIRIKSLSLGVVIPDITFDLARDNKKMALFSPYDVEKEYGKAFSDISITKEYENMLNNDKISKKYIFARKLFQTIAELHFESGYPYLMFDDTINNRNANPGRIVMSNLCSEIAQVSTPSKYNTDLSYTKIGEDICCNLGSLNIAKMMESGIEFGEAVQQSIRALDTISRKADFSSVRSVEQGNENNNAIGLGAMNLHGFFATNKIYYDSPEAIEFTSIFFYVMAYHAFKGSNIIAKEYGQFKRFPETKFADGSYFDKYTKCETNKWTPKLQKIIDVFKEYNVEIPTQDEWKQLARKIQETGMANAYLMAVAPTGSISYLSSCTPSLQPVVAPVETRKEGKLGRVYVPAYKISQENEIYYKKGAYEIGPNPIIDIVAAAQEHVDQAISLTLFMTDEATTRDLNKAYIRAFKKKCGTIYYVRVRQGVIDGSENLDDDCEACVI